MLCQQGRTSGAVLKKDVGIIVREVHKDLRQMPTKVLWPIHCSFKDMNVH